MDQLDDARILDLGLCGSKVFIFRIRELQEFDYFSCLTSGKFPLIKFRSVQSHVNDFMSQRKDKVFALFDFQQSLLLTSISSGVDTTRFRFLTKKTPFSFSLDSEYFNFGMKFKTFFDWVSYDGFVGTDGFLFRVLTDRALIVQESD